MTTRREFIASLGGATLGAAAWRVDGAEALVADNGDPLYPPIDLSYFDTPIAAAPSNIQFGYAAITWDNHDLQAIEDIAAVGFPGIQIRSPILEQFGSRPAALREMLARHHLTFVALSSGNVKYDPTIEQQVIKEHVDHAKFVHDVGGLEVLKSLRATHSVTDLPVIMATARIESEDVVEALNLGANDYVTKPIDFPVLLARIRTHSRRRRSALREARARRRALSAGRRRPGRGDSKVRRPASVFPPEGRREPAAGQGGRSEVVPLGGARTRTRRRAGRPRGD